MASVVVLLSGGLDSAVASYQAKKDIGRTGEVHALTFTYGQVHVREVASAQAIADSLNIDLRKVYLPLDTLVSSALLGDGEIPTVSSSGIPPTWVPQRNSTFLALAFAYAESLGADRVYTGFNIRDYSGYPDCRPEFVERMEEALNYASKTFVETGKGIGIITPLMYKRKWEIVKLGVKLGVPFELTTSCYAGRDKACGVCDSCRIRLRAFEEAGMKDPLEYET